MEDRDYFDLGDVLRRVSEKLDNLEIKLPDLERIFEEVEKNANVRVRVTPDFKKSVNEMGRSTRDQVVMVRIDKETREILDAWVATGAVKSRSEAAALFIREGLKVRANELDELRDALKDVEKAQENLRRKAATVFGDAEKDDASSDEGSAEESVSPGD